MNVTSATQWNKRELLTNVDCVLSEINHILLFNLQPKDLSVATLSTSRLILKRINTYYKVNTFFLLFSVTFTIQQVTELTQNCKMLHSSMLSVWILFLHLPYYLLNRAPQNNWGLVWLRFSEWRQAWLHLYRKLSLLMGYFTYELTTTK